MTGGVGVMVGVLVGAGVGVKVAVGGSVVEVGVLVLFAKTDAPEQLAKVKSKRTTKYR